MMMRRTRAWTRDQEEEEERRVVDVARARFSRLLGAWHSGWTRSKNLTQWLSRAVRVCSAELGLVLSSDGTVCGDHLLSIVNRALQTLPPPLSTSSSPPPQYDTEFPPLTVNELRRVVAAQPAGVLKLYYDFETETGRLRVGCFHGYASSSLASKDPYRMMMMMAQPPSFTTTTTTTTATATQIHVFRRAQLDRRLFHQKEGGGGLGKKKKPIEGKVAVVVVVEDVEARLLRCVADQPLDAMHFTYRYALGALLITQHVPPLVYCPATTPLLMDDVGAPLPLKPPPPIMVMRRGSPTSLLLRTAEERERRLLLLYHPLTDQYNDIVFHDTVASRVGDILEHGLIAPLSAPHREIYMWSWSLAPSRGRRRHDARFYVSLRRAMREGGLRFFMSHDGSIICPSPIPMRFLELDEPHPHNNHRRRF
jgi:hypothetical protein